MYVTQSRIPYVLSQGKLYTYAPLCLNFHKIKLSQDHRALKTINVSSLDYTVGFLVRRSQSYARFLQIVCVVRYSERNTVSCWQVIGYNDKQLHAVKLV